MTKAQRMRILKGFDVRQKESIGQIGSFLQLSFFLTILFCQIFHFCKC